MLLKALIALATGAGIAVPVSSAIKDSIYPRVSSVLKRSDSAVKLVWTAGGFHEEVGDMINGLVKVIKGEKEGQTKGEVIGLELKTSGIFTKDICKTLGFKEKNTSGLACEQRIEGNEEEIKSLSL
ncbi:hypothetical protein MSUIS_02820 [Mycoplasma suis KI3806]|uniref:Uncharacterized protein n=1 Tax=Mycoplasma suis (strain KI_3806) TaxID=708248 RepID=F0V3F3_MYCS3|nr:hypothetical protein [Mycoplasma suis]CBZ40375.1 hypothetical protein MSUIS_02820 [Mycoplasma suis KI3806]